MSENPPDSSANPKSFAEQLSEVASSIDVSNSLTVSLVRALDDLLQTANNAVNSAAASVLVRDGDGGGLRFLTATNGVTEELLALRLPPGAGIAGLVFSTATADGCCRRRPGRILLVRSRQTLRF